MKTKMRIFAFALFVLGLLSWLTEITFYGDVGADGILQDSFFLPLSFMLGFTALILFAVSLLLRSNQKTTH